MDSALNRVKWNADGLVAAIAQDWQSGEVLMLAWMNREALANTISSGEAVYWSRSRQQLWRKGESSGHSQKVKGLRLDCDGDTLLLTIEQIGGIACHTGRRSCFYRRFDGGDWQVADTVLKSPEAIYGSRDD